MIIATSDGTLVPSPIDFESFVGSLLKRLAEVHAERVSVTHHPRLQLQNKRLIIPDYELSYDLPFRKDRHLIECQHRQRYDQSITDRIQAIKQHSERNRFIFVYPKPSDLPNAVRETLEADGILHYGLSQFSLFLDHLCASLTILEQLDRSSLAGGQEFLAGAREWLEKNETFLLACRGELQDLKKTSAGASANVTGWPKDGAAADVKGWHKDEGMLGDPRRR